MKVDEWKFYYNEIREKGIRDVLIIFVTSKNNGKKVKSILSANGFYDAMVMEVSTDIYKSNEIPKEIQYRVFLTDRNNRIILVGSPLYTEGLRNLYFEQISNYKIE